MTEPSTDPRPLPTAPESPEPPEPRWKRLRRPIGWVLGIALIVAAVAVAVTGVDFSQLRQAESGDLIKLLIAVGGSLYLTGLVYHWITRMFEVRGRPVGRWQMQAIIAASTLLNYLPLKAGLISRAVYLKKVHRIGYRASAAAFVIVLAVSAYCYALLLGAALWFGGPGEGGGWFGAAVFLGMVVATVAGACLAPRVIGPLQPANAAFSVDRFNPGELGLWAFRGVLMRVADAAVMTFRVIFAAAIVGYSISTGEAIVLATVGMFIALTGITPNGLGLREWVWWLIGFAGFFGGDADHASDILLAIALVDRAAEAVVFVPTGLISLAWLRRRAASEPG